MRLSVLLLALCSVLPLASAQNAPSTAPNRLVEVKGIPSADLAPYPEVRLALEKDDVAGALLALAAREAQHENDPAYYDLTGLLALKAGNYAAAASAFERVVLMQPDNAGAWLDLAVASMEAGNYTAAMSYFDHIETNFAPPASLQGLIARFRARIVGPAPRPTLGLRLQAEVLAGVDTNANSGLNASSIPLTIGGDRADLPLDPSYNARRDSLGQLTLAANYKKQIGDSLLEMTASARQRSFRTEHDFNTLDLSTGAGLLTATRLGDVSAWLYASELQLGDERLMRIGRALAQLDRPAGACRLTAGLETEWRRYITLTNLNSNLVWGMGSIACEKRIASMPVQYTLLGRVGLDTPTGTRAGGRTENQEVIAQVSMPIAWGIYADLSHTVARAHDDEGYSPLLENNARRRIQRHRTRFFLSYPVQPGLEALFIVDDSRVSSNLALFQQKGRAVSMGFRKQF